MKDERVVDVVIVGAGLSGLVAAYYLEQAGKEMAILEARDRVGGRVYTVTADNGQGAFDLGPAWFWPHQQNILNLLHVFELHYFKQYETGQAMFEGQADVPPQRFMPDWQQPRSYRLVGGAIALIKALEARITPHIIHLNHRVQAITSVAKKKVTVQTIHKGQPVLWLANHVIVTLPPHLAATTITYTPPLPAKVQQAMQSTPTWMGEAMKVLLVYKRPFWREAHLSGLAVSYVGPVQQFHDATPADETIAALFGWVGNHSLSRALSVAKRRQAVIEQAVRLFGAEASQPLSYAEINWEVEPFTTNLKDNQRVRADDHPHYGHPLLQQPQMNGHLWWATTEASPQEGGYLDGAIFIGRAVATQIAPK